MRVSSQNSAAMMLHYMRKNNDQLNKLTEQSYTGKSMLVPSDDPISSTRLVQLQREQAAITQYQSNIKRLTGSLQSQESHLQGFDNALNTIKEKLLSANNGSHAEKDMQGFGQELSSLLDTLVAGLNSKSEDGSYLFGGTKNNREAVVYDEASGTYQFQGNSEERTTTVANGTNVQENVDASHVFSDSGSDLELLNRLKELSKKMQDPTIPSSDYQQEMTDLLGKVDDARDKNGALLTELGGRMNRLTLMDDIHNGVKISNESIVDDISVANPAELFAKLNMQMMTLQASNAVYGKISKLSLFDVI